jgi:hypothetical protein
VTRSPGKRNGLNSRIHYRNTDLVLTAGFDLRALGDVLEDGGLVLLHCQPDAAGTKWLASLETCTASEESPDETIGKLLDVIERLGESARETWLRCTQREFNIGYDCGVEPRSFETFVSAETIARMARLGISLGITIYPAEEDEE